MTYGKGIPYEDDYSQDRPVRRAVTVEPIPDSRCGRNAASRVRMGTTREGVNLEDNGLTG